MTPVVVFGAARLLGQTLLSRLAGHPVLAVAALADIGPRRDLRPFGTACDWRLTDPLPAAVASLPHACGEAGDLAAIVRPGGLVLSVLPDGQSAEADRAASTRGATVLTHAEDLRLAPDVPLLVPELAEAIPGAAIVATPNCTTVMLSLALAAILPLSTVEAVSVATLQAISGADLPGPPALLLSSNVFPHLRSEEDALERETARLFGGAFPVSAQSVRVPVAVGHTLLVSVKLSRRVAASDLADAWRSFSPPAGWANLPSAEPRPIRLASRADRPCPLPDAAVAAGMAITIGALRPCRVHDWRFVVVGDNMVRGAAGTLLLAAEGMATAA